MVQTPHQGQEDQQQSFLIPITLFSAENNASLREPPLLDVCIKLVWQFCADGFVTKDEPVMIRLKDMHLDEV